MSSDKGSPSNASSQSGTFRPARTIDLTADEIASSRVAGSPSEVQETAQQPGDSPAAAQVFVGEPPVQSDQPASASSTHTEPPTPETESSGANFPPPPSDPPPKNRGSSGERPLLGFWRLMSAGALGAVLALLVFSLLAPSLNPDKGTSSLDSRLAQVEQRLGQIAGRPNAASVDPKTGDDLASRLAVVETKVATPAPSPDT